MEHYTDILICGSGSAGVCAAAYLSRCGITSYRILEKRDGPLVMGQADGVQCRTVEIIESFGISEEVLREAFHVLEVVFWADDGKGSIHRTRRTIDTEPGLSHMPHVILNQARMNGLLIEASKRFGGRDIEYGWTVKGVTVDETKVHDHGAYCNQVTATKDGQDHIFHAKYVLACEGAHSPIRRSLGFQMVGDGTDALWGVMDVYPRTNFPDIRRKTTIHSSSGALLIIPREGGSLVRFYIELPSATVVKSLTLEDLQSSARQIFHPYTMEVAETAWWSVYAIGQRLSNNFHAHHRVFLAGDACHTHSPKAGQGMNVSMQDGYNIAWKLVHVLKSKSPPELLQTYVSEREKVATELIEFDRYFAKMWSSANKKEEGYTDKDFSDAFIKSAKFTAGLASNYNESSVIAAKKSKQHLAKNVVVGMRFPSAQVVRFCDAKAMQLLRAMQSDGRWRIVIFAGDTREEASMSRLNKLAKYLTLTSSPIHLFTTPNEDPDSFIEPILILSTPLDAVQQEQIPSIFWPITGKYKMRDLHKTYLDTKSYNHGHGYAYDFYQVNKEKGAVVVVRPDQYVALVVDLEDHDALGEFFGNFTTTTNQ